MGNFDKPVEYVKQSMEYDFYEFTDKNFPPRFCSMTPRLQAHIPKKFGWQMVPGYDFYLWVDRSHSLLHPDSVKWFYEQCQNVDIAVLRHPMRKTIQEEADYIRGRLAKNCTYLTPRYANELMDEQLEVIKSDKEYIDNCLFASTVFIYRNNEKIQNMMKEWWYHTSRFHLVDQFSFPYLIWKFKCEVNIIPTPMGRNNFRIPYLTMVRYG
jgi:hypothetical protein